MISLDIKTGLPKLKIFYLKMALVFIWEAQLVQNEKRFLVLFEQRLKDQFFQNWQINVTDSSKLKFYSGIKTYIGFENYLDILKVSKFRHVFASFRLSCHGLEIETGRHRGIDKVNRVCKLCINCVEDEYHFMFICKVYDDLRRKYMMPKYYLAPNLH